MHRDDNSKYLLYIEPKKEDRLKNPIDDEYTQLMEMALSKSKKGASRYSDPDDDGVTFEFRGKTIPSFQENTAYKGVHRTQCGEISSNCDYQLDNGMITNSLAPVYLRWYRYSIPVNDMLKMRELKEFYESKI
jgi:hypothetical protein